ncbi:hypothetical protein SD80_015870 [Scytonema tolypothrichoides VB-61278]|nr:hypothetical protein SD80_015870 [Scytonema tolypothrichoides VB-61278]
MLQRWRSAIHATSGKDNTPQVGECYQSPLKLVCLYQVFIKSRGNLFSTLKLKEGTGNREQGIGNREQGIENRE